MNAELINCFIDATHNVLNTVSSTTIKLRKPYLKKDDRLRGDISGFITLDGDLKGTIAVSFPKKSILAIVSKMFGEDMPELNDEIKDAVGEIGNMISGQATQNWTMQGKTLKASVSKVEMGENHKIEHLSGRPILAIPYATESGIITIEVCLSG